MKSYIRIWKGPPHSNLIGWSVLISLLSVASIHNSSWQRAYYTTCASSGSLPTSTPRFYIEVSDKNIVLESLPTTKLYNPMAESVILFSNPTVIDDQIVPDQDDCFLSPGEGPCPPLAWHVSTQLLSHLIKTILHCGHRIN